MFYVANPYGKDSAGPDRTRILGPHGARIASAGFNGDTMGFVPESFWTAAEAVDYPLAFEPEGGGEDESLNWSTMGCERSPGSFSSPPVGTPL